MAKGGKVYKTIEIRYTNTLIPGLSWTQKILLDGWVIGAGISISGLKGMFGKNAPDGGLDRNAGVQLPAGTLIPSAAPPQEYAPALEQPRGHYLPPSFFQGADVTSPSVSGSGSVGPADVKAGGGAVLVRNGSQDLMWETPFDVGPLELGVDAQQIGDAMNEDLGGIGGTGLDAGAEAAMEFGKTELVGDATFEGGEWGDLASVKPKTNDTWVPLHYARIYFDPDTAEVGAGDASTIASIATLVHRFHGETTRNPTKLFKAEIVGGHAGAEDSGLAMDRANNVFVELLGSTARARATPPGATSSSGRRSARRGRASRRAHRRRPPRIAA